MSATSTTMNNSQIASQISNEKSQASSKSKVYNLNSALSPSNGRKAKICSLKTNLILIMLANP